MCYQPKIKYVKLSVFSSNFKMKYVSHVGYDYGMGENFVCAERRKTHDVPAK